MITEYTSQKLSGSSNILLKSIIPEYSKIIGIVIESHNNKTGTVTLQTEKGVDRTRINRVLYIDYIDNAGFYSGNSAKDFFQSKQNISVKITGGLTVTIRLLIWEVKR